MVRVKFKKLLVGVTLATLGLVAGMTSAQDANMSREAIAERLRPVGELCLQGNECGAAAAPTSASTSGGMSGEEVFTSTCAACHTTGAAGAPIRGEAGDWAGRVEKGIETLYDHAINGFNAMPPKGGNASLSDADVEKGVNYLVEPVMDVPAAGGESADEGAADETATAAAGGEEAASGGEAAGGSDIDGGAIYAQVCFACHDTGAAGAPKRGDDDAWGPRLAKGTETLYDHAINGFNAMPPKGGNPGLSDAEVQASVDHLIEPSL